MSELRAADNTPPTPVYRTQLSIKDLAQLWRESGRDVSTFVELVENGEGVGWSGKTSSG